MLGVGAVPSVQLLLYVGVPPGLTVSVQVPPFAVRFLPTTHELDNDVTMLACPGSAGLGALMLLIATSWAALLVMVIVLGTAPVPNPETASVAGLAVNAAVAGPSGVVGLEYAASPFPLALLAVTTKVYDVPLSRLVTVQLVAGVSMHVVVVVLYGMLPVTP